MSKDKVCAAGICIDDQPFAEATNERGYLFIIAEFDGILGMAFKSLSVGGLPTFFDNLLKQGKIEAPVFSFWLNPDWNHLTNSGLLILGGIDQSLYEGQLRYINLLDEAFWNVRMNRVIVGSNSFTVCANGCKAIFDTGTSMIAGPMEEINAINQAIGAKFDPVSGYVTLECSSVSHLPEIRFNLGGQNYALMSKDYILIVYENLKKYCVSGFMGIERANTWVLGGIFMGKYYTVFDAANNVVGLALAKHY